MLSFTATLGIVTLGRYLSDHIIMLMPKNLPANICGKILGALAISLSASVFTLPVIYANFGYISVISPVVTLLSTIPITIILALAPFAVILTNVPFLLISVKVAINLFSSLFFAILSFFSSYSGLCVSLNYYFIKYVFVFFIVGIIIISLIRIKIKNVLLYSLPFIVAVSSFYVYLHIYNQSELNIARIVYITNKKSEGFIVKHGDSAMICDISDGSYAISKIADYLLHSRYSVLEIDTYMITHYHNRHVATLYKLSQNTFIGDLIMPVPTSDGERNVYDKLIAIAAEESFNVILYERGDENKIELYGAIQIGIMEKTMMSRSTHPLIALDFTYGEQKLLYIGGSVYESSGVGFIHERYGKSDAVIFGQHGPIIKKTAYPTISGKLQYIIYAAENVADTVDKTNIAGVNYKIHNEGDYFTEIIFIGGTK
jgi:competence protein ComEC